MRSLPTGMKFMRSARASGCRMRARRAALFLGVTNMKKRAVSAILAVAISCPILADAQSPENSRKSYTPSLGVIMGVTQLRHFKLWYAGNVRNWALADYELAQIKASCQDAITLYPNHPEADMSSMIAPAEEVHSAIEAKDGQRFDRAFEKLTSACNDCHKAVNLGFIEMRVPRISPTMTSPFSDQSFSPN
jgi:hypothetical protein